MGNFVRLDLPIFQVSAKLPKKVRLFAKVYEDEFSEYKDKLIKEGYTKISAEQMDYTYVPRKCPLCDKLDGHPVLNRYKRVRSKSNPSPLRDDQIRFKFHYNHSTPKPRQCYIGYLVGGVWKLSKNIDPMKMRPDNIVENDPVEWFKEPKIRKSKKLK